MTIAIVIGTHGWAAEQLLKTAEMLLGEQENVGWIDFVPGENADWRRRYRPRNRARTARRGGGCPFVVFMVFRVAPPIRSVAVFQADPSAVANCCRAGTRRADVARSSGSFAV